MPKTLTLKIDDVVCVSCGKPGEPLLGHLTSDRGNQLSASVSPPSMWHALRTYDDRGGNPGLFFICRPCHDNKSVTGTLPIKVSDAG